MSGFEVAEPILNSPYDGRSTMSGTITIRQKMIRDWRSLHRDP